MQSILSSSNVRIGEHPLENVYKKVRFKSPCHSWVSQLFRPGHGFNSYVWRAMMTSFRDFMGIIMVIFNSYIYDNLVGGLEHELVFPRFSHAVNCEVHHPN